MLLISAAIHVLGVAALVFVPLVFFNALPAGHLITFLLAAPGPPPVPPPPAPPPRRPRPVAATRIPIKDFVVPDKIPRGIAVIDPPPFESINPGLAFRLPQGVQGGWPGGQAGTGIGPVVELAPPQALPPPHKPAPRREPIKVSGGVQEAKLIHRVPPAYPALARQARVSGIVILMVTVNEEGEVSDVKVMSGHPLLDAEAVRAVRQWKYSPTLLNGEPVPVIAMVTVIFNLK